MAEESEKRFEAIMNKLFHTPPRSKPSNGASGHGVQKLSGRKRPHSSSVGRKLTGNVIGETGSSSLGSLTSARAPQCRPWDRSDLFGRLSTFKSINWFAKPQVVSPLECARRGWINVDVDTIACASCDARLLFSTPSAWTHQQVEKAAMVFSLKLESGHKLLCPWTNNACTEELGHPILSRDSLIEDYKKRFYSLSQLIALPVVVLVASGNLKTSQLEQFLSESSNSGCHELLDKSQTEIPGHIPETSSYIYYQGLKLISLFGWEPRILPYRVDLTIEQKDSVKDVSPIVTNGRKPIVNVYSSYASNGATPSSELQFDPSSVVLDCKLCGASVGLWAFSTIPRPLEYIRFVGHTEVAGKTIGSHDEDGAQEGSLANQLHTGSREGITNTSITASTSLGFTIAGGPPPAMMNYGATISIPIIGQNLRARLPLRTGIKDHHDIQRLSQVNDHQVLLESDNATAEEISATTGLDLIVRDSLEGPESIAEGSNLNLAKTVMAVDSTVADHPTFDAEEFSSSTAEDNSSSRKRARFELDQEQMVENHNEVSTRENRKLLSLDKSTEFDPIKQHRHFCPWITSRGKVAPGWQQMLSALEGKKELSNAHLSTLIEVDDPIESVRTLFASPNDKRTKTSGGS